MNEGSIFSEALQHQSGSERQVFLENVCQGNSQLRQRVEQLLLEHERLDELFDDLTHDYQMADEPKLPQTIGEFEIIRELALINDSRWRGSVRVAVQSLNLTEIRGRRRD